MNDPLDIPPVLSLNGNMVRPINSPRCSQGVCQRDKQCLQSSLSHFSTWKHCVRHNLLSFGPSLCSNRLRRHCRLHLCRNCMYPWKARTYCRSVSTERRSCWHVLEVVAARLGAVGFFCGCASCDGDHLKFCLSGFYPSNFANFGVQSE